MISTLLLAAALGCADMPAMDENFNSRIIEFDAVTSLVESNPECAQAFVVRGRMLLQREALDEGIATFRELVKHHPENSMARTWLGRALLSRADRESSLSDAKAAVKSLEEAIELDAMNLDARETLAAFHRSAPWIVGGDMDVADEQAKFVMQHDKLRGVQMLAANRMEDGDEDEAIELLAGTLAEHPEWDVLAVQLAIVYHGEGDYSNAYNLLAEYAGKNDPHPMAVYQLGRTAALSGEFLDAGRAAMRRYIGMVATDPELGVPAAAAWWRLGMIEEHADDMAVARAAYQKALEIDPDYEAAQDALDDLD